MFSLQTIFGKGDKFYGLLEASADAARQSTRALITMLNGKSPNPSLDEFKVARRREKEILAQISQALVELVDAGCSLVLTTGGTGPAVRDVTPEATLAVADKEMPGFGEQMRQISLRFVPTAILSRQVAVIRAKSLIINLPGQPKSIAETLEGLKGERGEQIVPGIFAAVPYCIDLIGGPYLEADATVCKVFRPKTAIRTFTD